MKGQDIYASYVNGKPTAVLGRLSCLGLFVSLVPLGNDSLPLSAVCVHDTQNETSDPAFQPVVSSGAAIEQLFERLHIGLVQDKHR